VTLSLCQQQTINFLRNRAWDWAENFFGPFGQKGIFFGWLRAVGTRALGNYVTFSKIYVV
jgi:hypothetical protein